MHNPSRLFRFVIISKPWAAPPAWSFRIFHRHGPRIRMVEIWGNKCLFQPVIDSFGINRKSYQIMFGTPVNWEKSALKDPFCSSIAGIRSSRGSFSSRIGERLIKNPTSEISELPPGSNTLPPRESRETTCTCLQGDCVHDRKKGIHYFNDKVLLQYSTMGIEGSDLQGMGWDLLKVQDHGGS